VLEKAFARSHRVFVEGTLKEARNPEVGIVASA